MERKLYKSEKLLIGCLASFKSFRDKGTFCDFSIHVDQDTFNVHKLVMAACSDYFRAMLTNDTTESRDSVVSLNDVSSSAMKSIIDYCYTSEIEINIDNVQDILVAASIFMIEDIKSMCEDFIRLTKIDISNCLGLLTVADRCGLQDLCQITLNYCLENFPEIVRGDQFLDLSEIWLSKLISHDELNVDKEEEVLRAVIEWTSADVANREAKFDMIVRHVRFSHIEPPSLLELSANKFILQSKACQALIEEAKNYLLLRNYPELRSKFKGQIFKKRTANLRSRQRIYAVGGWTHESKPTRSVEQYNPYSDQWIEIEPMSRPRCGVGATVLGDSLYAVGGHDGLIYLKSIERFDFKLCTWSADQEIANMKFERTSVGVVALDGYIYAIGGQSGNIVYSNVERYDPKTNTWKECASMVEKRCGAGVTVLNDLIYVIGGVDQVTVQTTLKTVERYNPTCDHWELVAPMTTCRKHLGCATYKKKIYAVGGHDGFNELETAECYDSISNTWTQIPSMNEKRSGVALVELHESLYAIGGHSGVARLKSVEAYDPVKERWVTKKAMNNERLGGGLAVHPKSNDYSESHKFCSTCVHEKTLIYETSARKNKNK